MITTGKFSISPVLSFYIDVHFPFFIISLPAITYTSFYSTQVPDKLIFKMGKLK